MNEKQAPCEPKMRSLTKSEVESALRAAAVARAEADAALEAQGVKFRDRQVCKEAKPVRG